MNSDHSSALIQSMLLSPEQIKKLINCQAITKLPPWSFNNSEKTDQFIRECIDKICKQENLVDKSEFENYGSGHASFVDCWLYRPNEEFRIDSPDGEDFVAYTGLTILFCRLTNKFVMFEGQKTWGEMASSSYMPDFDKVDVFESDIVGTLAKKTEIELIEMGWTRALRNELDFPLPDEMHAPTILEVDYHRHFDALFYWVD